MISIGSNDSLIKKLVDDFSLISSTIKKLSIHLDEDEILCIEVKLKLAYKRNVELLLKFTHVHEYSFLYSDSHIFYNIESYKFINFDNYVYISFDPIEEENEISYDDQDFIKSLKVEGFILES